ncbi:MAG TPA: hypothetical protein VKB93_04030 [Thermoanaerobaculia bacterium]|nr:hypothetical protein [Thermoanaerobaculia bacterium]
MPLRHVLAGLLLTGSLFAAEVRISDEAPLAPQIASQSPGQPITGASNGNGYLALWSTGWHEDPVQTFRPVVIDADGKASPAILPYITIYRTTENHPLLASDGLDYLAAWLDGTTLYSQRFRPDGSAYGEAQVVATLPKWYGSDDAPRLHALLWNGSRYALIAGVNHPKKPRAWILDRFGGIIRWLDTLFVPAPGITVGPWVLWAGTFNGRYTFIAGREDWSEAEKKYAARLTLNAFDEFGLRTDTPIAATLDNFRPDDGYFGAASDDRIVLFPPFAKRFVIIDTNGSVVSSGPIPELCNWFGENRTALWDGEQFVVACSDGVDLRAMRISPSGIVIDTPAVRVSKASLDLFQGGYSPPPMPLLVSGGASQLLIWKDRRQPGGVYSARTLHGAGAITESATPRALASYSGSQQLDVRIARGGGHRMAVWRDHAVNGESHALFDQTTCDIPSPCGILTPTGAIGPPAVVAGARGFLIVSRHLYLSDQLLSWFVGFDGRALDFRPTVLTNNGSTYLIDLPSAVWHQSKFVVSRGGSVGSNPADLAPLASWTVTENGFVESAETAPPAGSGNVMWSAPLSIGSDVRMVFATTSNYAQYPQQQLTFGFSEPGKSPWTFFAQDLEHGTATRGFAAAAAGPEQITLAWTGRSLMHLTQTTLDGTRLLRNVVVPGVQGVRE